MKNQNTTLNINYLGMMVNYDEDMTIGNCIARGFSTEKTKAIISEMRENGIAYLSGRNLAKYI